MKKEQQSTDISEIQNTLRRIYEDMESTLSRYEDEGNQMPDSPETDPLPATEPDGIALGDDSVQDAPKEQLSSDEVYDMSLSFDKDHEMLAAIKGEVAKAIIGYEDVVEDIAVALLAGGHVLIEGYPGVAKTTLAKAFTKALGISYNRLQFTPDMLPQDVTGHYYFNQKTNEFEVRKGPVFTNILLADEINRTTPKTQSALLEAMQERQVTIEGRTFFLEEPFMVIATTNPIETEGVYSLPLAQADRFTFKLEMGYLGKEKELDILRMKTTGEKEISTLFRRTDYLMLRTAYREVFVDDSILSYIRDIVYETRSSPMFSIGASPRAGEMILKTAKARACLRRRDYVIPDDVKYVCRLALRHRLLPSPEYAEDSLGIDTLIERLITQVAVPLMQGKGP
ncbi:MAG: MoxR family ATPase [Candidatus Methanofastidiosa archaeon]|nr:MoxR family ATPase [Candidatus Methanofastidiosa archaeon]